MAHRIPLTPYDRLFLAGHLALRDLGLPGHVIVAILELGGAVAPDLVLERWRAALRRHPLLEAPIGYAWSTARAHWRLAPLDGAAPAADAPDALTLHDLSGEPDPAAAWAALRHALLQLPLDPARPPHVRLHLVRRDAERTTLVLRYPHYLMDLGGGWRLLREMAGEFATSEAAVAHQPAAAGGSGRIGAAGYLDEIRRARAAPATWTGRRLRRWWQGLRLRSRWAPRTASLLGSGRKGPAAEGGGLQRAWPSEIGARIESAARQRCAPGPLLYTRHALIAVAQALDDLREPLGLRGADYLLAAPMARPGDPPRPFAPMNDLTIAVVRVSRALLSDPAAADAEVARQLEDYRRGGDEATWTLMEYAGWLRIGHYRRLLRRGWTLPAAAAGVTVFRAEMPEPCWLGARVERFSALGLPTIPPGAMVTFTRLGSTWTLGIAYFPRVLPHELAERLADGIERRLGVV